MSKFFKTVGAYGKTIVALIGLARCYDQQHGIRKHLMEMKECLLPSGENVTIVGAPADPYFQGLEGNVQGLRSMLAIVPDLSVGEDIYDIGANIGISTVMLAKRYPHNSIVAIEASKKNFDYLSKNIELNGCKNVEIQHVALSDSEGILMFHESDYGAGSHVVSQDHLDGSVTRQSVKKTTLDRIWRDRKRPAGFCKIDVEGHEPNVLAGAQAMMTSDRPPVFIEFNSWCLNAFGGHSPSAFAKALLSHFSPKYVDDSGSTNNVDQAVDLIHKNMVRDGCVTDLYIRFNGGDSYPTLFEMVWPIEARAAQLTK